MGCGRAAVALPAWLGGAAARTAGERRRLPAHMPLQRGQPGQPCSGHLSPLAYVVPLACRSRCSVPTAPRPLPPPVPAPQCAQAALAL